MWHLKFPMIIWKLVHDVMNKKPILNQCFKHLILSRLLRNLSQAKYNCLIIGKSKCWLVNAKTYHKNFFIGTEKFLNLRDSSSMKQKQLRLLDFLQRHASMGA